MTGCFRLEVAIDLMTVTRLQ